MSRHTGGRQRLELRAGSKAAAERDAKRHGLDVLHVDELPESATPDDDEQAMMDEDVVVHSGRLGRRVFVLVLLVVTALIAAYVIFPQVRSMLEP